MMYGLLDAAMHPPVGLFVAFEPLGAKPQRG